MRFVLPLVLSGLLFVGCEPTEPARPALDPSLPECDLVEVVRVVDGDTIIVDFDGAEERVRYIGIDTPESAIPGEPVEPFGLEASSRNTELLDDGWVCLEFDISERDRFERLLRYPWLPSGVLVSEVLLEEGLATVVTFPPDVKYHESLLLPAQERAQETGVGIWE